MLQTLLKLRSLALIGLLLATSAGGCAHNDSAQKTVESKNYSKEAPSGQKQKPDFDPVKLSIVPQKTDESSANVRLVKPGHWTEAAIATKANNFDFVGDLSAEVKNITAAGAEHPELPYRLRFERPAALPKGQEKFFNFMFFVPELPEKPWLATELQTRGGSLAATPGPEPLVAMKPYQYFLVVVSSNPDRYRPLETLDSMRAPRGEESLDYYRVVAPPMKKPLPLPSSALAWSSIAYVIWDDADPELLSLEQQQAMLDWLHQGGQLIISGPNSLASLNEKMYLYPYLPFAGGEPKRISAAMLAQLNDKWMPNGKAAQEQTLTPVNPWSGVDIQPRTGARFVPGAADLVVEGPVGRGRIVVTAFRLTERELWNWPGFDNFFNACVLGRPPRKFSKSGLLDELAVDWADAAKNALDPQWVTRVRYLARDWNDKGGFSSEFVALAGEEPGGPNSGPAGMAGIVPESALTTSTPPLGAWNDSSSMANAARGRYKRPPALKFRGLISW